MYDYTRNHFAEGNVPAQRRSKLPTEDLACRSQCRREDIWLFVSAESDVPVESIAAVVGA